MQCASCNKEALSGYLTCGETACNDHYWMKLFASQGYSYQAMQKNGNGFGDINPAVPSPAEIPAKPRKTSLTADDIEAAIVSEDSWKIGQKTTVVLLTLRNGFEAVGTSACVDPANYNAEIGKCIARERAIDKIWELEGYLLQSKLAFTV